MRMIGLMTSAFLLAPGIAAACPDIALDGAGMSYTAAELYTPKTFGVIAGGNYDLDNCKIRTPNGDVPTGFVAAAPDFELWFESNGQYDLEFRIDSECDSVLLINTAAGNFYFDDDDNGNLDAKIRLSAPSQGLYDIWIGTLGPSTCNAQLTIESF
jgi:hypothetical protein